MIAIETFEALSGIDGLVHGFINRVPSVDVDAEREVAMERLEDAHDNLLEELGTRRSSLWTAEQVHGNGIAMCSGESKNKHKLGVDGLITEEIGTAMGIYVADCCAVFLVDVENRICALLHSGKCGTELAIVSKAIELMQNEYGTKPEALIAQLSPCIRPPWYEIDFAATIREQCRLSGLMAANIHDPKTCTGENVERYYSYRREKGRTGRMLAVLGFSN